MHTNLVYYSPNWEAIPPRCSNSTENYNPQNNNLPLVLKRDKIKVIVYWLTSGWVKVKQGEQISKVDEKNFNLKGILEKVIRNTGEFTIK